jgi:DNA-binding ferritin-like protein
MDGLMPSHPTSADVLHTIIDSLEKLAWMIKAENRGV